MKNIIRIVLSSSIFVALMLVVSCHSEMLDSEVLQSYGDHFKVLASENSTRLKLLNTIAGGEIGLSPVKHMCVGNNDMLYVCEYIYGTPDSLIKIIDPLERKLIGHLTKYGEDPESVGFVNGLYFSNGYACFLDDSKVKLSYWPIKGWDGISYPPPNHKVVKANSGLISDAVLFNKEIFTVLLEDADGKLSEHATSSLDLTNWMYRDSFPIRTGKEEGIIIDNRLKPAAYESVLCVSPENDYIALGYTYTDKIKVLDRNYNTIYILVGPDNFDPVFKTFSTPNGGIAKQPVQELTKYAWLSIISSDNYLYALYSGKPIAYEGQPDSYEPNTGNTVFKINWRTGDLIEQYILPGQGNYRIAVDAKDKYLYTVSDSDDTHIEIYSLY